MAALDPPPRRVRKRMRLPAPQASSRNRHPMAARPRGTSAIPGPWKVLQPPSFRSTHGAIEAYPVSPAVASIATTLPAPRARRSGSCAPSARSTSPTSYRAPPPRHLLHGALGRNGYADPARALPEGGRARRRHVRTARRRRRTRVVPPCSAAAPRPARPSLTSDPGAGLSLLRALFLGPLVLAGVPVLECLLDREALGLLGLLVQLLLQGVAHRSGLRRGTA